MKQDTKFSTNEPLLKRIREAKNYRDEQFKLPHGIERTVQPMISMHDMVLINELNNLITTFVVK